LENRSRIVYFDEEYPNAFIGYDEGRRLAEFLTTRNFAILDASELEGWMRKVTSKGKASFTCVVFAMDIIPEQVFGDVNGNVLFRRYLDAGGRIVWVGDIPAWYKGKSGKEREEAWQLGSFVSLLGIAPVMANCVMPVEITSRGRDLGLHSTWYSMRPVLIRDIDRLGPPFWSAIASIELDVLAWTNVTIGRSVVRSKPMLGSIRGFSIGAQAAGLGGRLTLAREEQIRVYNKRCASAWHIAFNPGHRNQGFFRIWDHPIRLIDLTDERLQELHELATQGLAT